MTPPHPPDPAAASGGPEAQNVYDDPDFFAGYATLERSRRGLDGAPEWPTLRGWLPPLGGRRVVDLGCGYGWFARWAADHGASEVLAIDVSARMLEQAAAMTDDERIRYERADLATVELPSNAFDVAYSSLTLHYIPDLDAVFSTVRQALVDGGTFVFSIEHPIFMASLAPGWITGADGERTWPVDHYADEGRRVTNWFADGVVKFHRTLGTILTSLITAGFTVDAVADFAPTATQLAARPELAEELDRPMFLLVTAHVNDGLARGRSVADT